jgi:hypothetical protein
MESLRFVGVAVGTAVIAFSLTFVIWPIPPSIVLPPSGLVPYFAFVIACECLSFGVGVAFLAFGFPLMTRLPVGRFGAWSGYLGIAWFLLNWWPHESFHRTTPSTDFVKLIGIQFGFHLSLIVAAFLVARFFAEVARAGAARTCGDPGSDPRPAEGAPTATPVGAAND